MALIPLRCVRSWAPVRSGVSHWEEFSKRLRHMATQVSAYPDPGSILSGQILWATDVKMARVGIAWRWAQLRDDVVVILNPMDVSSNLALVDDLGIPLAASQQLCQLHLVIHDLPWQDRIRLVG